MLAKIAAIAAMAFAFALPAFASTPVNINTADASTIAESIDGIGLSKAKAIVAYREEHGPFKSVDDLTEVKGIGAATLQRIHDDILLTGSAEKPAAGEAPAKAKKASKPKPPAQTEG